MKPPYARTGVARNQDTFRHATYEDENGCWIWTRSRLPNGYGRFQRTTAHRVSYELFIGPIPEGMEIDHVAARGCKSKACVNPAHLEAVTHKTNMERGPIAQRTHCPSGHPYDEANTIRRTDTQGHVRRFCRECNRINARVQAARRRALAQAGLADFSHELLTQKSAATARTVAATGTHQASGISA